MSQQYVVSVIQKGSEEGDKAFFHRAGFGFENRDGSINFKLDLLGDVQLHIAKKKDKEEGGERGARR